MNFIKRAIQSVKHARTQQKELEAQEARRTEIRNAAGVLLRHKHLLEVGTPALITACVPYGSCLTADQEKARASIIGTLGIIMLDNSKNRALLYAKPQ